MKGHLSICRFLINSRTKIRKESISQSEHREKKVNKNKHSIRNLYDRLRNTHETGILKVEETEWDKIIFNSEKYL